MSIPSRKTGENVMKLNKWLQETFNVRASDYKDSLIGKTIYVDETCKQEFETIYKHGGFDKNGVFVVTQDNMGKTKDGSNIRIIQFCDSAGREDTGHAGRFRVQRVGL
mgnify:CR=1 FL=1